MDNWMDALGLGMARKRLGAEAMTLAADLIG